MTMAFAGHYNETDGWRAVLYKAWVLKNGSLEFRTRCFHAVYFNAIVEI